MYLVTNLSCYPYPLQRGLWFFPCSLFCPQIAINIVTWLMLCVQMSMLLLTCRILAAFLPTLFLKLVSALGRPAWRLPCCSRDPYLAVRCCSLLYFSLSLRAVTEHRVSFVNDRRIRPSSDGSTALYFLLIFSKSAWRPLSWSGLVILYVKDSISFREILTACW